MTDKSKSGRDQKRPQQGAGNLGQKDAQQEQHSETALGQMGERSREGEKDKGKRQSE